MRFSATASLLSLAAGACLAHAEPAADAGAQLLPRQASSVLVGYLSATSGVYTESRTCDFGMTLSTSASYAKCCPTSGSCDFATSCSGDTLLGGSAGPFACNTLGTLACKTAILAQTAGADGGPSWIDCWQQSISGDSFTFVQNIGSATFVLASTTAASTSPSATNDSSPTTGSSNGSPAAPTTDGSSAGVGIPTPSPSTAAAAGVDTGLASGGVIAAAIALVQAVL